MTLSAPAEGWHEVAAARRGKMADSEFEFIAAPLCAGEAVALQDVVGERVPEHDGADFFDTANGQ